MGKALLFILAIFVFAGCATMPVKSSTRMAKYNKLVIRNINWNETAVSDLNAAEMKAYMDSRTRLNELFQSEFGKHIKEIGYFDNVTYGNGPVEADSLILEPKIYTLKPSGYMPGASYTGMLITAGGKLVGKYAEERRTSNGSNPQDTIEKLIIELAEDAASKLPFAR